MEHKCKKTDIKSIEKCELNAEIIKKALEEFGKDKPNACPYCPSCPALNYSIKVIEELTEKNAIQTITAIELDKQVQRLTEENERLRAENEIKSQKRANIFEIADAFERGRTDGIQKMQERLKAEAYPFPCAIGVEYAVPYCKVEQIAKEMLEGKTNDS